MPPRRLSPFLAKKVGNWDAAYQFFDEMGYRVKTITLKSQEEIVKKLKKIVVGHLLAQDLNWAPLRASTKEHKYPKNANLILIDTELYLKSISTFRVGNTWMIGIKKGIAYRRRGSFVNVDRVAVLLEYGTTKMVPRPLWTPSIQELGGAKGIRNYIAKAIYEKLKQRARGGPVDITKKEILDKI